MGASPYNTVTRKAFDYQMDRVVAKMQRYRQRGIDDHRVHIVQIAKLFHEIERLKFTMEELFPIEEEE